MSDRPDSATDETLVAYVRGRLPSEEADRIAAEAAQRPRLAAEIALMRGIVATVDEDASTPTPGELGWARLSRALDAEPTRSVIRVRRPVWQLVASAAAAVLIWQVVAVPFLSAPGGRQAGYAPVSEQPASGFSVSVAFQPTATEEAIRALVRGVGARISDGPSAIGLWQLSFGSSAARDAGLARLQAADIVESAQVR